MKKIRIKILNYDPSDAFSYGRFIIALLERNFKVELSENPDFLFYNESSDEYLNYDCIRIFYTGENISPNFNLCDYAISFDHCDFEDRHYRLPLFLITTFYRTKDAELAKTINIAKGGLYTLDDIRRKRGFCSFVYNNYLADPIREEFFHKLSTYKKVDAGGKFLNNTGNAVSSKLLFDMDRKFNIAFENSSRSGYLTEKLPCAIVAGSVPVYWGDPRVGEVFNKKRFINIHDFESLDAALAEVKRIDSNDELFLSIINEPAYAENFAPDKIIDGCADFLHHIMSQDPQSAKRRTINKMRAQTMTKRERIASRILSLSEKPRMILALVYQPFKRFKALESLKMRIARR
jgi:hypothetical protein